MHAVLVGESHAIGRRRTHGIAMERDSHGVVASSILELVDGDAMESSEGLLAHRDAVNMELQ